MPAEPQKHKKLLRLGVVTYVSALLLIAAFCIAFHFVADSIVHRQEASARIVNISGRQRMLCQRIARLSLERAAQTTFRPDAVNVQELNSAIDLMEASHLALLHGSPRLGPDPSGLPGVHAVYFSDPWQLNTQVESFLLHAHRLANTPQALLSLSDPDLAAVDQAAHDPLLNALNAAVTAREIASDESIQSLRRTLAVLTLLMLVILLLEALFLYRPLFQRLGQAHTELVVAGRTDPLTGSLNRRAFTEDAVQVIATARSTGQPLSVLMIDIDHFKAVNDNYGHPAGDLVINAIVNRLLTEVRASDILCRMGGEEFAIMLPGDSLAAAAAAAERFRSTISAEPVSIDYKGGPQLLSVSVSIGVAQLHAEDTSLFTALSRADSSLYAAKQNGRNRVETELSITPEQAAKAPLPPREHVSRFRMMPRP